MTFGHLGFAAALRGRWKESSLLWLLPASLAPDFVDVALAALGICNPYGLYSHTIPVVALLALVVGGGAWIAGMAGAHGRSAAAMNAAACATVVLLHPALDFFTGFKLIWPGSVPVGLELYAHPLADFALETLFLFAGWAVMRRAGAGPRWTTTVKVLSLAVLLQATASFLRPWQKPNACGAEVGRSL